MLLPAVAANVKQIDSHIFLTQKHHRQRFPIGSIATDGFFIRLLVTALTAHARFSRIDVLIVLLLLHSMSVCEL